MSQRSDMPPNANSGGGSKKNKKNKSSSSAARTAAAVTTATTASAISTGNATSDSNGNEDSQQQQRHIQPLESPPKALEVVETADKISEDLLNFSSSDRSSLSSRPFVKDSPEDDEDVPVVARTVPEPVVAESESIEVPQVTRTLPELDEMLVDMSLDDSPAPPPRKPHSKTTTPPTIPQMNSIITKTRNSNMTYIKGQVVRQSAIEPQTLANQVVELMASSMSKTQTTTTQLAAEKAEWVQLTSVEKTGEPQERLEVLVVGLSRGYQIWTMSASSEFEEVLSERQGPVRALKVLPNNLKLRGKKDKFADQRPLIAVTDASSHIPDRQYCSVNIISLLTGNEVHKIKFDEPVCAINVSDQFLVVSLSHNAHVYDILTFKEVRQIRTAPSCENCPPALSLSCQLLAYTDQKLDANLQSSGGLAAEVEPATTEKYSDQFYSAMSYLSKSVKSISESVGAGSGGASKSSHPQGVITVLNLATAKEDDSEGVMCHYVAHVEPISYISFSPDQRLILSADANANVFNIFLLMPHATTSSLAAAQHLYKLNRGSTPAKVISTAFSEDCRWLAISTNHGTTHVFAVCPFGGKPNQRTHGDTFVNRESRFHRSAGLTDTADVTASIGPSKHRAMADSCSYTKEHPVAINSPVLAKTNGNTRVGPFPPPLLLVAIEKIKDSRYTKEDLTAWAADLTSFPYPGSQSLTSPAVAARRRLEVSRMSVMFRMRSFNSTTSTKLAKTTKMLMSTSLVIAKVDAAQGVIVVQHEIKPLRKEGEFNMDAPPQVSITPIGGWVLQRTKNNADMHAPMPGASPLIAFANYETEFTKRGATEDFWTPHVETRTYLPPHRWLWQGPQFELFSYREEDDNPCLMSPGNKGSNASFKSIPVLVGSEAVNINLKSIPADATRIECGSYTSANSYSIDQGSEQPLIGGYNGMQNGEFEAAIAEAIKDISSDDEGVKKMEKPDDQIEEFFDTESSATFARNGSATSSATPKGKKKKAPPASAPLPNTPTASSKDQKKSGKENGSRREKSNDSDDFGTFDMEDI